MIDDFISIGKITSTFGLKGFLKVASSSDILSSLKPNSIIYINRKNTKIPFKLKSLRRDKNLYILSLEEFDSIEKSEGLVGEILYFPSNNIESLLGPDEFFSRQLIGLQPYFNENLYSGFKILEILENPVHPILLFSNGEIEILIPYINQFVGKVDLENKKIEILNWEDWILAD